MRTQLLQDESPSKRKSAAMQSPHGVPRHPFTVWASMLALPGLLVVTYVLLLCHDVLTPFELLHCWKTSNGGLGNPGPALNGAIMHWLAKDWGGEEYRCEFVPPPVAVFTEVLLLLLTWWIVIWSSKQTRGLRRKGVMFDLVKLVFEGVDGGQKTRSLHYMTCVDRQDQQVAAFLSDLKTWGQAATWRHVGYTAAFQATMFAFDWFVKGYTLRLIIYYQIVWFSFTEAAIMQVGLWVMYCVRLSLTLVDMYIEVLTAGKCNYLEYIELHRQLEIDLIRLWGEVNFHTVMPALPFLTMSLSHLLCDPHQNTGLFVATFLLSMGGVVLFLMMRPIAKISTAFNNTLVLKGEPKKKLRKVGSLSIVAVARRLANASENRTPLEEQRYTTFLEYVQGSEFCVSIGVPGVYMLPISSRTAGHVLSTLVLKFPAFVSLYLGVQQNIAQQRESRG